LFYFVVLVFLFAGYSGLVAGIYLLSTLLGLFCFASERVPFAACLVS
jgi:hypothetical protein